MTPNLAAFVVGGSHIVHEEIDGEVIAIDLSTGAYFSMRGVAASIWRAIAAHPVPPQSIADAVGAAYADEPSAADDAQQFIGELLDLGLVTPATDPSPARPIALRTEEQYAAPTVEKFTDMQELILLDPVHEVDAAGWPAAKTSSEPS